MNKKQHRTSKPGAARRAPNKSQQTKHRPKSQPGEKAKVKAKVRASGASDGSAEQPTRFDPIRLGFVRGVTPTKWATRWRVAAPQQPLELVAIELAGVESARDEVDLLLERVAPGQRPFGTDTESPDRHAVLLYEETVSLVVPIDHELAKLGQIAAEDLALVTLIDHPDHQAGWPATAPWADESWRPRDAAATLELVAAQAGCALMAQPLAKHVSAKRSHAVIPVVASAALPLPGTEIWASWSRSRDAEDIQHLVGVLRGRTARSSRGA